MALNFSQRPNSPVNLPEEISVYSVGNANDYFFEGIPEKNSDEFGKHQLLTWEVGNSFGCGMDWDDREGFWEPVANDILHLLPLDPFDMGLSTTFAAMKGLVDDCKAERLSIFWKKEAKFPTELGNMVIYERSYPFGEFDGFVGQCGNASNNAGWVSNCSMKQFPNNEDSCLSSPQKFEMGSVSCLDESGEPHDALAFSFRYLDVPDLLSVERVCRSLRTTVQSDALLWRSIHINHPLNERITDDALLRLTNKAQGLLQSLYLADCLKITDEGLKSVLDRNPRLTKLNVSGCTKLSIGGIVSNLMAFKSSATVGIKHLGIGDRYGITQKHFEDLKSLIGAEECMKPKAKPHFYHNGHSSLSFDDDQAIDIEMCPRCQKLRLVYDCPVESCQEKQSGKLPCRACINCIARCIECGRCINDTEYEETFCFDLLCANC